MNEPSDPQRPTGDDRPRETAAFEDTEFSFGDAATRSGFTADVVENKDDKDDAGNATDGSVVDADVVDEESLGHTSDPEMTGIIPAIRDDSPRPADLAAPATAVEVPAETEAGGDDGDDGTEDDDRSGFRRIPSWGWILIVGAVLAVVVGLITAALMRGNESSGPAPLTSVEPNYERPEAWNGEVSPSADVPTGGQNYGYDPYSDGSGGQSWDSGSTDGEDGSWDNDENAGPTDTTDDGAGDTGSPGTEPGGDSGNGGNGDDSGESGDPGTETPGGDTGDAGDTGDTAGETTE